MGKRNKPQISEDTPIKKKKSVLSNVLEIEEVNLNDALSSATSKQRKDKKRKHKKLNPEKHTEVLDKDSKLDELVPQLVKIGKKKKFKKGKVLNEDSKLDELVPQLEKTVKKNKLKTGKVLDEDLKLDELVPQLEKIEKKKKLKKGKLLVDNDPREVQSSTEITNNAVKKNKFLNDDEAEVQDEDIDKFCDELNEEDNKQYEDWVKLIEAKLHENKKSK